MRESNVFFGLGDNRYPAQFNRDQLRLGRLVHVRFGEDGEPVAFSPSPSPDARPFCVTWIAPSEWYVVLEDKPRGLSQIVEEVVQVVRPSPNRVTVERAVSEAASDIRLEFLYKTAEYERSRLNFVVTVADRLDLYARLSQPEASKALWIHWGPLCVYLLLTCFDRLGQPADWMPFGSWLEATRTRSEREAALNDVPAGTGHVEAASALYKAYNARYGVRSSFYRFLHELLPSEQRDILLSSMEIESQRLPPCLSERTFADESEKENYLFKLRNDYTHKSQVHVRPLDERIYSFDDTPEHMKIVWHLQEQTFAATAWKSVTTRNWPQVLEDTVRVGLRAYLVELANGYCSEADET